MKLGSWKETTLPGVGCAAWAQGTWAGGAGGMHAPHQGSWIMDLGHATWIVVNPSWGWVGPRRI